MNTGRPTRLPDPVAAVLVVALAFIPHLHGQFVISEFLADNEHSVRDEDGDRSDWIEIECVSTTGASLEAWALSDVDSQPGRWRFPSTNLPPGGRLLVFASGKDRRSAGHELHTNFRLNREGGYLALTAPNGRTPVSRFSYGPQFADISFGTGAALAAIPWLTGKTPARILAPATAMANAAWTGGREPFDDLAWRPGAAAIGFERAIGATNDLLGFWDFNEQNADGSIPDRSGARNDGQPARATLSAPGTGRSGSPGDRAINFAGTGVMTLAGADRGMFLPAVRNDAITLSLWIRGADSQPSNDSLFWAGSEPGGGGIRSLNAHVPWSDQVIYWDTAGCCDAGLQRVSVLDSNPAHWKSAWNHYVFIKNGSTKEIWQNGRLLLSAINTATLTSIRSFILGAVNPSGSGGYHGRVDDLGIWAAAIPPAWIAALASGSSPFELRLFGNRIETDIGGTQFGVGSSAYVRIPFVVDDPAVWDGALLEIAYNDGFVAYINGTEVARRHAPVQLAEDSEATTTRAAADSVIPELIPISHDSLHLSRGSNLLALHALNASNASPEFLLEPVLRGRRQLDGRYFTTPTPGQPNPEGVTGVVEPLTVTPGRSILDAPVNIRLRTTTPGAAIHWTLDGSEPGPGKGTNLPGPDVVLQVTNTTLLRAVGIRDGFAPSPVATHTYLFPANVASQRRPRDVGATWPGGAPADFTMDSRIVQNPVDGHDLDRSLRSLPAISIVAPPEDLFGRNGIYANSEQNTDAWERAASFEWILPDGGRGAQAPTGLSIHGNISRQKSFTPKHGFNATFRRRYGAGDFEYPLFADSHLRSFDRIVLRGGSTDTWPVTEWDQRVDGVLRWYRRDASYVRDQWVRDTQLAMGHPSAHGTFAHLYLNGLYWGLYNACERPDHHFAAAYLGGDPDDYDVLADFADLHAGNANAWNQLMSAAGANLAQAANYQRLLGRRADGTRDPALPVLLDVTNLVDYMVLHVFIGADDWPNHNWWAARRRTPDSDGFRFFAWDQEISINSLVKQHSSWGPIYAEADAANSPAYVYARCRTNPDFRQLFADRVQFHLFGRGALSISNNIERWNRRIDEIDDAVVAESARWGDYQRPAAPYRREVEWLANHRWMQSSYFPSNHAVALRRFRNAQLFPTLAPPAIDWSPTPNDGRFALVLGHTNSTGTILLTTDGTDPRLPGGASSRTAIAFTTPIPVTAGTVVLARTRSGAGWSPLVTAVVDPPTTPSSLEITEIHYHPEDASSPDAEFIELRNSGPEPLRLDHWSIAGGIQYTFPSNAVLAPRALTVLAANPAAFAGAFPGVTVSGTYAGRLSNSGDSFSLRDPAGNVVWTFAYDDEPPWNPEPDGRGASLQRASLELPAGSPLSWRAAPPSPGRFVAVPSDGIPLVATLEPDGFIRLTWNAPAGTETALAEADDPARPEWRILERRPAADTDTTWSRRISAGGSRRYFTLQP